MTLSYKARVEAGAQWLDQVNNGWILLINLEDLDITDAYQCVLAQVFGSFYKGDEVVSKHGLESCDLGFDIGDEEDSEKAYTWLDRRWRAEIDKRQKALAAQVVG